MRCFLKRSPWFFRHQTDANVEINRNGKDDALAIKSHRTLTRDVVACNPNTSALDLKSLANNDFVFFGVEMTDHPHKQGQLLSTTHNSNDFGAFAYLIPETNPRVKHGYLTLGDHLHSGMLPMNAWAEGEKWEKTHPEAKKQFSHNDFTDTHLGMTPMFRAQDMKKGLALYMIHNLRQANDDGFRQKVFNARANDPLLHDAIHLILQPEFHIPRIVATRDYLKIAHREPTIDGLISAGNTAAADQIPLKKEAAIERLDIAVRQFNPKTIDYLLHRFELSAEDIQKIPNIQFFLSRFGSTPSMVRPFLEKNLIDVNKPFKDKPCGDVMLKNCITNSNRPLARLLIEYGANPQLLRPEHQIDLHNLIKSASDTNDKGSKSRPALCTIL